MLIFLSAGAYFLPAQKQYMLNDGEAVRFKLARQLYQRGKQLLVKGNYDRAEKAFKNCLEKLPKFSYADYYLGQLRYKEKKYMQALEHVKKAKESYKFISRLWLNTQLEYMKRLQQHKFDLEDKVRTLQNNLNSPAHADLQQRDREAWYAKQSDMSARLARAELDLMDVKDKLRATVPTTPEMVADYHYLHGNILFKLKKYNDAYAMYLEAVRLNPGYAKAYRNLANLNYMAKRYKEAMSYLGKAEKFGADIDPKFKSIIANALSRREKE